LASEPGSVVST